jgi:hypothetical protein
VTVVLFPFVPVRASTLTPLLVVNTSEMDFAKRPDDVDDLLKQIRGMGKGTQYYVPLGSKG